MSASQLERLRSRLAPFGLEWTRRTGRPLATARDGVDFLASMKGCDDFWAALGQRDDGRERALDLAALRKALPDGETGSDIGLEQTLRSIGLSDGEIHAVIDDLDEPLSMDGAIRSAFAQGRPQGIARALERILETSADVLAAERYAERLAKGSTLARTLSTVMGIALFLIGTACGPAQGPTPGPQPPVTTTTTAAPVTTPAPTPVPVPAPVPAPITTGTTPAPPTPLTPVPSPTPVTQDDPPAPRPVRPPPPRPPAPRYKGVSPRVRGRSSRNVPA